MTSKALVLRSEILQCPSSCAPHSCRTSCRRRWRALLTEARCRHRVPSCQLPINAVIFWRRRHGFGLSVRLSRRRHVDHLLLAPLVGHGNRGIARAFELGAPQGALGRKLQVAVKPRLVTGVLPIRIAVLVLSRGKPLRRLVGPIIDFGQPVLAERGDPGAGLNEHPDLGLGLIKDDQRLFALRLVGRAGCPAASVLSWFRPARHLCYFCSPAFDIPQSFWESSCSESLACHSLVSLLSACEAGVERRRACDARARYGAHIIGSGPHLLPLCFRWPPRRSRREHHLHDALELGLDVLGQHALAQGLPQVSVEGCLIEAVALCVGLL